MAESAGYRFVAVLNREFDTPLVMNALGHMMLGLAPLCLDSDLIQWRSFVDSGGAFHSNLTDRPLIILEAKKSAAICQLRKSAQDAQIPYNVFTSLMYDGEPQAQQEAMQNSSELDLQYVGICLFGPDDTVRTLTRKFSLMK